MRNLVTIISVFLFFCLNINAQTESKVTFAPEKPCNGDSLTVYFTAVSKSPVINTDTLLMQAQFYSVKKIYIEEYTMKKWKNAWKCTFKVPDNAGCIVFQFSDTDFENVDHNDTKNWDILIYDKSGIPVKGAYAGRADSYMVHMLIRREQNMDEYNSGILKEWQRYPDDLHILANSWYVRVSSEKNIDSTYNAVKQEMESTLEKYPDSLYAMKAAYYIYKAKDKEKAAQLNDRINQLEPKKNFDLHNEWNKILFMPKGEERLKTFYNYYQKAKGTSWEKDAGLEYFRSMIGAKYYKQASTFLDEWKKPELFSVITSTYSIIKDCQDKLPKLDLKDAANNITIEAQKNELNETINIAKNMSQKAVILWQKSDVSERDKYTPPSVWTKERRRSSGMGYVTMAQADLLLKNYESSEVNFLKAKELLKKEFYYPLNCESYVKCMIALKKYDEAFDAGIKIFENVNWDKMPELKEMLLTAAKNLDNNKYNVNKRLNEIAGHNKVLRVEEIKEQFKARYRQAPDFSLKDLNGKEYSLSALKGKIAIIEFWNTSCGWCEKSAPYFQSFYNKHKNDKGLVILSVNCDPTPDQKDKDKYVKKFINEKKWKFPIAIDYENKVTVKFRPGGVPVTFFVGPNNYIYYTEEGFPGLTMIEDFEKIVDMIRNDSK